MKKIGFIGCGNMGKAMVQGLINSGIVESKNILVSDRSEDYIKSLISELAIVGTTNNKEVAKNVDILFLAVKPNVYEIVINEIKDIVKSNIIIVTIAAGIEIGKSERWFGKEIKIIRAMPNTPALVGEGMSAICANKFSTDEDISYIKRLFNSFGKCEVIEEKHFHAFTALCGSSPAYAFLFIEAMADAAVKLGIPRSNAYTMASQSLLGSAKMVLETGKHPGVLKDMVCSPGGTTIDAVAKLEEEGFRSAIIKALEVCADKSEKMSK